MQGERAEQQLVADCRMQEPVLGCSILGYLSLFLTPSFTADRP